MWKDEEGTVNSKIANAIFYVVERNDGYIFIQRYLPRNYGTTTYRQLATFNDSVKAVEYLDALREQQSAG